jgi:hypothetical protein
VLVRSCFSADAAKDHAICQACEELGSIFVNAGPLSRNADNAARSEQSFTHAGVANPPSKE